jgi:Dolichyl-phosphate-mannose-protein mannosyltransferase
MAGCPGGVYGRALALLALFGVALALRLVGIGFGLPYLFHPDEPAYVLQALAVAGRLPNGLTFADPPLYKYVLLGEYAITYVVGRLAGVYASPQDVVTQFRADPSTLYLIGRATSALFGALTALATAMLGAAVARDERTRPWFGWLAGGLAAVTYTLVRESHFAVNDALVTLLVTVGLLGCVEIAHGGSRRWYVATGVATGLACAAKYYGLILLVPFAVAHLLRPRPRRVGDVVVMGAAGLAATLLTFPSLLVEPGRVLQDIYVHLYVSARTGYDGLDPAGAYVYYVKALEWGLGRAMLAAAVVGGGLALARRERPVLVVASLPVTLYVTLGSQQLFFARFLLPGVPALVVLAALGVAAVPCLLGLTGRVARVGAVALLVLVGIGPLVDVVRFDLLLTQPDTRTQARDWVATRIPPDALVAVDAQPLGPPLSGAHPALLVADGGSLDDLPLDDYARRGVVYLVTSSFTSDVRRLDPLREAQRQTFYAALPERGAVVVQFRPYAGPTAPPFVYDQIYGPYTNLFDLDRPGPTVTVYQLASGARTQESRGAAAPPRP